MSSTTKSLMHQIVQSKRVHVPIHTIPTYMERRTINMVPYSNQPIHKQGRTASHYIENSIRSNSSDWHDRLDAFKMKNSGITADIEFKEIDRFCPCIFYCSSPKRRKPSGLQIQLPKINFRFSSSHSLN